MQHPHHDDDIQRLRRQLRSEIDAAAKSFAEVLHVVCDLLIEMAQQKAVANQEPVEAKSIPEMLTPQQAADHLGVTPETLAIWRCTRCYAIAFVKVGSRVRYRRADLDTFLRNRTENRGHQNDL